MLYYSTNNSSERVDFKEATMLGQAPDGGLYFPERIPLVPDEIIRNLSGFEPAELAFQVIAPYVGSLIPEKELRQIVAETVDFPFPLVHITDNIHALELYHGPTLAFKDVGARFMSRCLSYFIRDSGQKITVLVATSGDTGSAVANGFFGVAGIEVVILYPSGKVSMVQELQLTTYGGNITALEIDGSFDDCQRLVKQAFRDEELRKQCALTSANSINVARWLPQQFYYFFALRAWAHKDQPPVIAVPSGNFGNLCAGLIAHLSGLPVAHFVAACNSNDVVTAYLNGEGYHPKAPVVTMSNAMDVADPSNFVRMLELFHDDVNAMQARVTGYTISEEATRMAISEVHTDTGYIMDPHGAVAYAGLQQYLREHGQQPGILLETAAPIKFADVVEPIIGKKIAIPATLASLYNKEKQSIKLKGTYAVLKEFLLK
ncbi:MAG: threonine synthase [Chitinophagaceae bacterium]